MQLAQVPQEAEQQPDTAPKTSATPKAPELEMKKPQYEATVGRYDPREKLPNDIDPQKNPEAWVKQLIRDGNGRYASTYLSFKDSDNKVVAVVPIELQAKDGSASENDFPVIYVSNRDVVDVSNITCRSEDNETFSDKAVTVDEKGKDFRDKIGYGPEGGSGYALRFRLEVVSAARERNRAPYPGSPDISQPTDGTFAVHGRVTYDNQGLPCRYLPNTSTRLVRPTGTPGAFLVNVNGRRYEERSSRAEPGSSGRNLRSASRDRDIPEVSVSQELMEASAEIDYANKTVDGSKTSYPISFSYMKEEDGKAVASQKVSGTLVVGDGQPRVEPTDNALLQSSFAKMLMRTTPTGQPILQRWTAAVEIVGAEESDATVTIGKDTIYGVNVQPISLSSDDGKSTVHAFMYVDSADKIHLLNKEQVSLIRPEIAAVTPVTGEENKFSTTVTFLVRNKDNQFDRKPVPIIITKGDEGYSVSYDEDRSSINDGKNGAYSVEQAKAEILQFISNQQLDILDVEGKPPKVSAILPITSEEATDAEVTFAQRVFDQFSVKVTADKVLEAQTMPPRGLATTMSVELENGARQDILLDSLLPVGVEMGSIQFRQPTLLEGKKVLPFTFQTTSAVEGETSHTGYFRIVEGAFGMRKVGENGAIRFDTSVYFDGLKLFSELHKDKHSDEGFIPLSPKK